MALSFCMDYLYVKQYCDRRRKCNTSSMQRNDAVLCESFEATPFQFQVRQAVREEHNRQPLKICPCPARTSRGIEGGTLSAPKSLMIMILSTCMDYLCINERCDPSLFSTQRGDSVVRVSSEVIAVSVCNSTGSEEHSWGPQTIDNYDLVQSIDYL